MGQCLLSEGRSRTSGGGCPPPVKQCLVLMKWRHLSAIGSTAKSQNTDIGRHWRNVQSILHGFALEKAYNLINCAQCELW